MKKRALHRLFARFTRGGFAVKYWDGDRREYGDEEPRVELVFNEEPAADDLLEEPAVAFGEAYMDEVVDFEGEMEDIFRILQMNWEAAEESGISKKVLELLKGMGRGISRKDQKENIQHHYDLGNEFFSLWLDETMSYSCAYFCHPDDDLKKAQLQKVDHILKKLHLKPGQRLLDIGSGWGLLPLRAAEQYQVEAVGITLSDQQVQFSRHMAKENGLDDQLEFRLENYLDLDDDQSFDRIVSVGMFEHVGKQHLRKYMEKVASLLSDGGLSLLHSICGMREGEVNPWIRKYIFPGGYIPSLREILWLFPEYDFHLIHAESLRLHYALTLQRWHENFSEQIDEVERMFDRRFVRMWELYLRSCAASFRTTGLDVYQLLFSKGLNNNLPLTFKQLYSEQSV